MSGERCNLHPDCHAPRMSIHYCPHPEVESFPFSRMKALFEGDRQLRRELADLDRGYRESLEALRRGHARGTRKAYQAAAARYAGRREVGGLRSLGVTTAEAAANAEAAGRAIAAAGDIEWHAGTTDPVAFGLRKITAAYADVAQYTAGAPSVPNPDEAREMAERFAGFVARNPLTSDETLSGAWSAFVVSDDLDPTDHGAEALPQAEEEALIEWLEKGES